MSAHSLARTLVVLALLAVALCGSLVVAQDASPDPVVEVPEGVFFAAVKRHINLESSTEDQTIEVKVGNSGATPVSYFLIAIPTAKAAHLAYAAASAGKASPLEVSRAALRGDSPHAAEAVVYKVDLAAPLAAGAELSLELRLVFTHTMQPLPKAIAQDETQFVEFEDSVYWFAAHPVRAQTTALSLASDAVEAWAPTKLGRLRDRLLSFGPFETAVPAWTRGERLYAHFANEAPFATMRVLVREIEVSHWGNVAVSEQYLLEHTGAKLSGGFLRSDYQSGVPKLMGRASFRSLQARLPRVARDIYFRDAIGNVSTTAIRVDGSALAVELMPRYPMFGGWRADLDFGYNLPARTYLSVAANNPEQHILQMPFAAPVPRVPVDALTVRVILPEGATDIAWGTSFDVDAAAMESRLTYLDTSGRPVLVLQKRNVVPWDGERFTVVYSFKRFNMLREPLILVAAFLGLVLLTILYVRVDFSLGPTASTAAVATAERAAEKKGKEKAD